MRTFIALELSTEAQQQACEVQDLLRSELRERKIAECVTWTPVAKIHLTLRFLGDTSQAQQAMIASQLTTLVRAQAPFALLLGTFGCFPHVRAPNIVWLDVQGAVNSLRHLQAQVEQAAQAAGFAPETRFFTPHITIGRTQRHCERPLLRRIGEAFKNLREEGEQQQPSWPVMSPFVVNQLVYMASELRPEGARYTPLAHYEFGKR